MDPCPWLLWASEWATPPLPEGFVGGWGRDTPGPLARKAGAMTRSEFKGQLTLAESSLWPTAEAGCSHGCRWLSREGGAAGFLVLPRSTDTGPRVSERAGASSTAQSLQVRPWQKVEKKLALNPLGRLLCDLPGARTGVYSYSCGIARTCVCTHLGAARPPAELVRVTLHAAAAAGCLPHVPLGWPWGPQSECPMGAVPVSSGQPGLCVGAGSGV